jgi:hypothetical protein
VIDSLDWLNQKRRKVGVLTRPIKAEIKSLQGEAKELMDRLEDKTDPTLREAYDCRIVEHQH